MVKERFFYKMAKFIKVTFPKVRNMVKEPIDGKMVMFILENLYGIEEREQVHTDGMMDHSTEDNGKLIKRMGLVSLRTRTRQFQVNSWLISQCGEQKSNFCCKTKNSIILFFMGNELLDCFGLMHKSICIDMKLQNGFIILFIISYYEGITYKIQNSVRSESQYLSNQQDYNQKGLLEAKKTVYEPEITLSDRIDTYAEQNFTLKPL